jgi:Lar family restriction alleviation protein
MATQQEAADVWNGVQKRDRKLEPCPLCGSSDVHLKGVYEDGHLTYYIQCNHCDVKTDQFDKVDYLVDMWNCRESVDPPLRDCPLCGGTANFYRHDNDKWSVCCRDADDSNELCCGLHTKVVDSKEEAAALWNGDTNG